MAKRTKKDLGAKTSISSQAEAYQSAAVSKSAGGGSTRIIAVPLSRILPDPTQARVILPPDLYMDFYFPEEGREALSCYQVAGALLAAAAHDPAMQRQVDGLLALGSSILAQGQIEPASGYREQFADGSDYIRLLVGERRFWSLALMAVEQELEEEPGLAVIVREGYSLGEQLAENLQREDLTPVDLAKGIASLILGELGEPLAATDPDYMARCRSVLGRGKMPAGVWDAVRQHVPHSRQHLGRLLNILRLPDDLLYLASISGIPESVLREVLAAPQEQWPELVSAAAQDSLTAAEIQTAVERGRAPAKKKGAAPNVHKQAATRALALVRLTQRKEFKDDFQEAAGLISARLQDADALSDAGERLVALGMALRDTARRRDR